MKKLLLTLALVMSIIGISRAGEVTYTFSEHGYENAQEISSVKLDDNITITLDKGGNSNGPKYYTTGTALRLYSSNTMKFEAANGAKISKIKFNCASNYSFLSTATASVGTFANNVWTGDAGEILITNGTGNSGQTRITSLAVTYTGGGAVTPSNVSTPDLKLLEGEYAFMLEMSCATEGAAIHYTLDGTTPTADSELYTAPIEMWQVATAKAVAVKDGELSDVASLKCNSLMLEDFSMLLEPSFPAGTNIVVKGKMTAIYQNGDNAVVRSGYSNMLLFGKIDKTLANGDTFNRLEGVYSPYNTVPEITNPVISETTPGTAVAPYEATVAEVTENHLFQYLTLKNVTISDVNNRNFNITGTDDEGNTVTVAGYDNFKNGVVTEAIEGCDLTGFVGRYSTSIQFWPIEVTAGQEVAVAPTFNPESGAELTKGATVEITAPEGYEIYWKYSTEEAFELYNADDMAFIPFNTTAATITIDAYSVKGDLKSETVSATYTIVKRDPGLAWIDAHGEPVAECVYNIDAEGQELPYLDGIMEADPTITSSDEKVALFDAETWGIKVVGVGTAVITATLPETASYKASTASYTLRVIDSSVALYTTSTIDFTSNNGYKYTDGAKYVWKSDNFEFETSATSEGSTYPQFYSDGLRIYGSDANKNKLTVCAPENQEFKEVVITADESNKSGGATPNIDSKAMTKVEAAARAASSLVDYTYTFEKSNVTSFVISAVPGQNTGNQLRINKIAITTANTANGVSEIENNDANAPVEFYNLQGVRIENPANSGIYIRRQGNTVMKVIIR